MTSKKELFIYIELYSIVLNYFWVTITLKKVIFQSIQEPSIDSISKYLKHNVRFKNLKRKIAQNKIQNKFEISSLFPI